VEIHLIVALEQAAEEQTVDVLGLGVGGETRVEIGGIGFEEESEGGRVGFGGG
jgi:aldehyde:ferredoxin oxidoreductase